MFHAKIGNRREVALDDYCDFDIDINVAISNYKTYQNSLMRKKQDIIAKWCKEINTASTQGKKYIVTNQFIVDNDKDKILWLIDDAGCVCEFAPDSYIKYFQKYFEDRGFDVTKIEYPQNNACCLRISWIFN